jgi:hypothetical protein
VLRCDVGIGSLVIGGLQASDGPPVPDMPDRPMAMMPRPGPIHSEAGRSRIDARS